MLQQIYKKFNFVLRKTTIKKEIIGGIITFFAMIYILPVNSGILNGKDQGIEGIPYGGVFLATALTSAIGSIMMGLFSNLPIGIAPGMGSNIFFVSTMMQQFGLKWEYALSVVLVNGLIFTFLAILGVVDKFISSIPQSLKYAFILGLGVYLAYVGLQQSKIATISGNQLILGDFKDLTVILSLLGILLIFVLAIMKVKMSILITLFTMSFLGMIIGQILNDNPKFSSFSDIKINYNEFNSFNNVFGQGILSIPKAFTIIKFYPSLLALIFMTLIGSSGTIVSIGQTAQLEGKDHKIEGSQKGLISIGASSILAGVLGTSTSAGFLESHAGVKAGARTGFSSIIVGGLFLFSIPLFPLIEPLFKHSFVTTPILIYIGSLMVVSAKKIEWEDHVKAISSFVLVTIMWFTGSMLNGIAFGLLIYTILEVARKNWKALNFTMCFFTTLFGLYIILMPFIK